MTMNYYGVMDKSGLKNDGRLCGLQEVAPHIYLVSLAMCDPTSMLVSPRTPDLTFGQTVADICKAGRDSNKESDAKRSYFSKTYRSGIWEYKNKMITHMNGAPRIVLNVFVDLSQPKKEKPPAKRVSPVTFEHRFIDKGQDTFFHDFEGNLLTRREDAAKKAAIAAGKEPIKTDRETAAGFFEDIRACRNLFNFRQTVHGPSASRFFADALDYSVAWGVVKKIQSETAGFSMIAPVFLPGTEDDYPRKPRYVAVQDMEDIYAADEKTARPFISATNWTGDPAAAYNAMVLANHVKGTPIPDVTVARTTAEALNALQDELCKPADTTETSVRVIVPASLSSQQQLAFG